MIQVTVGFFISCPQNKSRRKLVLLEMSSRGARCLLIQRICLVVHLKDPSQGRGLAFEILQLDKENHCDTCTQLTLKTLLCCCCVKGRKQNCVASDKEHWQQEQNTSPLGSASQASQKDFLSHAWWKPERGAGLGTFVVPSELLPGKVFTSVLNWINLFCLLKGQNKKVSLQSSQLYSFPAWPVVPRPASLISAIYIWHTSLSPLIFRKPLPRLNHAVFTASSDISAH